MKTQSRNKHMKANRTECQLSLQLSFTNPTPAVLSELSTLLEIADSHTIAGDSACVGHYDGTQSNFPNMTNEQRTTRKDLRRLAGCVSIATKQDWHTVWVLVYHRFFEIVGKHPVTESMKLGMPTHLDYVCTSQAWIEILRDILDEMLTGNKKSS